MTDSIVWTTNDDFDLGAHSQTASGNTLRDWITESLTLGASPPEVLKLDGSHLYGFNSAVAGNYLGDDDRRVGQVFICPATAFILTSVQISIRSIYAPYNDYVLDITDAAGSPVVPSTTVYGTSNPETPTTPGLQTFTFTVPIYIKSNTWYAFQIRHADTADAVYLRLKNSNFDVTSNSHYCAYWSGAWTGYTVTGDQVWEWDTYGVPPGCAKMNGYSGGAVANEDWLISPAIDLSNKTLSSLPASLLQSPHL